MPVRKTRGSPWVPGTEEPEPHQDGPHPDPLEPHQDGAGNATGMELERHPDE